MENFKTYNKTLLDGRRKLLPKQYDEVKKVYKELKSQRKTAKHFGISRSLVAIIINPDRAEKVKQRTKEHWRDYKKPKSERNEDTKKYRNKKRKLGLAYNPNYKKTGYRRQTKQCVECGKMFNTNQDKIITCRNCKTKKRWAEWNKKNNKK